MHAAAFGTKNRFLDRKCRCALLAMAGNQKANHSVEDSHHEDWATIVTVLALLAGVLLWFVHWAICKLSDLVQCSLQPRDVTNRQANAKENEVQKLRDSLDSCRQEIQALKSELAQKREEMSNLKSKSIFVTKTGQCWHLDPQCRYLKNIGHLQGLQKNPCSACVL